MTAMFRSGDELMMLLRRAREIELAFEQDAQWEGYYEKEALRAVLMELIVDSARHAVIVQGLMDKVKVSAEREYAPLQGKTFNFRNRNDLEMMMDIGHTERLMRDIYSSIRDGVKASPPGLLKDDRDMGPFMEEIETLIKAETHHAELVIKYVGKVERIH
jgi:hypothetical protein